MSLTRTWVVDWRSQFTLLRPYFEGAGGVVHVHAGPGAPSSAFARGLRSKLQTESWPFTWSTVQIAASNANTHYLPDIIRQIAKTAGLPLPTPSTESQPAGTVNVGTSIKARGNVTLSNIDVTLTNSDYYGRAMEEEERIASLCRSLRTFLERRRMALIFLDSHQSDEPSLIELGRKLWDGALSQLVAVGLLVVDIFDPLAMTDRSPAWPPEPDLIIPLPDRFVSEALAAAREDLVAILIEVGCFPTLAEATASAETMLAMAQDVRTLYAGLGMARLKLGVRRS